MFPIGMKNPFANEATTETSDDTRKATFENVINMNTNKAVQVRLRATLTRRIWM